MLIQIESHDSLSDWASLNLMSFAKIEHIWWKRTNWAVNRFEVTSAKQSDTEMHRYDPEKYMLHNLLQAPHYDNTENILTLFQQLTKFLHKYLLHLILNWC